MTKLSTKKQKRSLNPKNKLYDDIIDSYNEMMKKNWSLHQLKIDLQKKKYTSNDVIKIIDSCQKFMEDNQFLNQFDYYITLLEKYDYIYKKLKDDDPKNALKALQEHEKSYFKLNNLINT